MGTLRNSTARLVFESDGARHVQLIRSSPFTIGRGADCSPVICHPQVSREHASIERDGSGYVLRDQGSKHRTFVNGVGITCAMLHSGDSIRLGGKPDGLVFEDVEGSATCTLLAQLSEGGTYSAGDGDSEKLSLFLRAAQSLSTIDATNDVLRTILEYSIQMTSTRKSSGQIRGAGPI